MSSIIGTNIKAVLFDHDDTLVGTLGPKWKHHKFVAATHYQRTLTDEELAQHWGKPLTELVCILYGTDNAEEAMAHNFASSEQFPKELFVHTIPTLMTLKARGLRLGVVTATVRRSFERDLKQHNFPVDIFDYVQTAEDTSFHKPDHRVFEPALQWLSVQDIRPEEVLYVGDGLHDMKAALGAGFSFIGVETGLVRAAGFKDAGAVSVADLAMLVGAN